MAIIRWDPFREMDRFFEDDWFPVMPRWHWRRALRSMVDLSADEKEVKIDIILPEGVDVDKLKAEFKDGVLSLRIPRKPERKTRAKKVDIKVKK